MARALSQTVLETLTLAAHFSLGNSLPPEDKAEFVTSVINDLGEAMSMRPWPAS